MEHIAAILQKFGVECLAAEQINTRTWRINNTYILKAEKDLKQLKLHTLITEQLQRFLLPVAQIVPTLGGEALFTEGDNHYMLSKILPGKHIENIYEQEYLIIAQNIGRVMARLHQALLGVQPLITCWDNNLPDEMQGWIKDFFEADHYSLVAKNAYDAVAKTLAETYDALPRQLIHRDFHFGNLLFEHGEVTGYIDFDLSQINCRIFDLCYFASGLLVDAFQDISKSEKWFEILKGLIVGYESVSYLIPVEKISIISVIECIELLFAAFCAKNNNPGLAENAANMYRWVEQNKGRISEVIDSTCDKS